MLKTQDSNLISCQKNKNNGTERILGIDPGTARLGYALVDFDKRTGFQEIIDCGIIKTHQDDSDAARLVEMRADLEFIIERFKPTSVSVEKLFFFKNLKTVIPVAQARGVVLELAASKQIPIYEYTPLEMKKIITGNGMAKKDLVSKVVHEAFKLKTKISPDDAIDAIGMALCYARSDLFTPSVRN